MPHDMPLVTTLAAALAAAWAFGIVAQRVGLSPIVGYLLAGIAIGPHTPGFVGDVAIASQLAEIGVALLMFGVGLHFHLDELLAVRGIAVPGALLQSGFATLLGLAVGLAMGWPPTAGLVFGLALSVASTVVLMRGLESRGLVGAPAGHAAIGWLVFEDILTVAVLVVLPIVKELQSGAGVGMGEVMGALGAALAKLLALVALVMVAGSRAIPRMLELSARLRSRELFTLTVLALALAVAAGAAHFFGVSMALGAFLAGMLVGQTTVSQQAAADVLPLRDAFAVLFFVSVGMLLDPAFLVREPFLVLATVAVIVVGKGVVALAVVALLAQPVRTGLVVALGLAQIGEFSFILGQMGRDLGLLPPAGASSLVAGALVTIALNPFLFRALDGIEDGLRRTPWLWRLLAARAEARRAARIGKGAGPVGAPGVVIVGFGPVGQTVDRLLRQSGIETVVVDLNLDAVQSLRRDGRRAVYGDASQVEVLREAGVGAASALIVTLPHSANRRALIAGARELNPSLRILVRARYLREGEELARAGADAACYEEVEAAVALARALLRETGTDEETIRRESERVREDLTPLGRSVAV
ncbi:MAG TPA: cation:proton antiporter [Vicinamibacteria bacterium]|nr:cation:proton antiporter [Vicinamibacteria bacterium]